MKEVNSDRKKAPKINRSLEKIFYYVVCLIFVNGKLLFDIDYSGVSGTNYALTNLFCLIFVHYVTHANADDD